MPLTERSIAALPFSPAQEIADPDCKGLKLRVGKRKVWFWVGRDPTVGKVVRKQLGVWPVMNLKAARVAADDLRSGIAKRATVYRDRGATFDELCDAFLERHSQKLRPNSIAAITKALRRARREFGPRPLVTLRRGELINFLEAISDGGQGPMANAVKSGMNVCFKWGVVREMLETNPLDGYSDRPGGTQRARERALTVEEVKKALAHMEYQTVLHADAKAALRLILTTGRRPGEICGLEGSQVDLEAQTITIPPEKAKNKRCGVFLMTPAAVSILKAWPVKEGRLFQTRTGDEITSKRLGDLVRKREWPIDQWTPHDLRRTAATGARECGAAVSDIGLMLGHTETGVTAQVYAKANMEEQRRAVAALSSWLFMCGIE